MNRKVCKCGHNKTDHQLKTRMENGITVKTWRGECGFVGCGCKLFEYSHSENHWGEIVNE